MLAAAVLVLSVFLCDFAQAAGEFIYSRIGQWQIEYKEDFNSNSCYAFARFDGETQIQLALIQDATKTRWVVYISNSQWKTWIGKKENHILQFKNTKRFYGTFTAIGDKTLAASTSVDFINSLADAQSLTIMSEDNHVLIRISMKDSGAAIRAVVNCIREHPLKSTPAPEARVPPSSPSKSSAGTGFFFAPNRLVTNYHVVKECRSDIQVRYPDRKWYEATISGQDDTNDLAILYTDMENLSVASFRLQSEVGESVATYGFPYAGILSSSGNFTMGTLGALSGMNDDSRFMQISAPIQPGNSGGPLLDMSGSVIGIVQSTLNALSMMQFSGSVPQNVNFAVQAPIIVNFLLAKGETSRSDSSVVHQDLPPAQVANLAKKFTVQVYCGGTSPEISQTSPPRRDAPGGHDEPPVGAATLLGTYGGWGAYFAHPKAGKMCFAMAKPFSSHFDSNNQPRNPPFFFVSTRPAAKVQNELSIMVGYDFKPGAVATIEIGTLKFSLYTQSGGAWIKNLAEQADVIQAMRDGTADIIVKGTSTLGAQSTDHYSPTGFGQALDRAVQECRQ